VVIVPAGDKVYVASRKGERREWTKCGRDGERVKCGRREWMGRSERNLRHSGRNEW